MLGWRHSHKINKANLNSFISIIETPPGTQGVSKDAVSSIELKLWGLIFWVARTHLARPDLGTYANASAHLQFVVKNFMAPLEVVKIKEFMNRRFSAIVLYSSSLVNN